MNSTAIVFLCKYPEQGTLDFAQEIRDKTTFEVIIISDDPCSLNGVIHLSDQLCENNGYINSNISDNSTHIKKNPIAWDKALLFLCTIATHIDQVWIFEDDCFIPSVDALLKLNNKYRNIDLVAPNNFENKSKKQKDWHWRSIYPKSEPPYYYSMVCACGMTRNMLNEIKKYVSKNKELFYIEVMFNTLAMQAGLSVYAAKELKSIVWIGDWDMDAFLLLPNNIFHPMKNSSDHAGLRTMIEFHRKNKNYKPVNNLPEFLL